MKIAVTYENGQVFQHFGHTEQFKIYEAAEGKVVSARVVETGGSGHGALAGFLRGLGVDTLICGGIGGGARSALAEAGALLAGSLAYDPNTVCSHHDHGEGHTCGHHHEGGHTCGGHDHGCGHHG